MGGLGRGRQPPSPGTPFQLPHTQPLSGPLLPRRRRPEQLFPPGRGPRSERHPWGGRAGRQRPTVRAGGDSETTAAEPTPNFARSCPSPSSSPNFPAGWCPLRPTEPAAAAAPPTTRPSFRRLSLLPNARRLGKDRRPGPLPSPPGAPESQTPPPTRRSHPLGGSLARPDAANPSHLH